MTDRNANRKGCKKTHVGWIPEEWVLCPLNAVAVVQAGIAKGKSNIRKPVRLPYLRVANVQDGHVDLTEVKEITVAAAEVDRYKLQRGDVLFTEGGDFDKLGRGCVWSGQINPCLHQNHVFAVRCSPTKLLPYILASLASSPYGRRYFTLSSKQSTNLASINSSQLKAFPLPLPPFPEQKKIAEVLSTWDEGIAQNRALLNAAKRRKKALMQQLLTGKKRLRGSNVGGGLVRREGWKDRYLGELFTERNETRCTHLPLLAITRERGIIPAADVDKKDSTPEDKSLYKRVMPRDIGYNTMRMWQGVSAVSALEGIVSPAYTVCTPGPKVDAVFASYLFKYQPVVHVFWRHSQGLVDDTLSLKYHNFARIRLPFPALSEQRAIAAILTTADEEIRSLEVQCAAFERQKKGLMQKLLTGEVRVKG